MKKIDIYIIKKFLGTFFLAIALIICIAIVFDVSEKMEDFLDKDASLHEIMFDYYLNFIPYFANLFSPLFVFISVIFFTSRMAAKTEFIAMFSSGISLRRLLVPYLFSAFIVTLISLFLGNYVIPDSSKKRVNFEYKYVRNQSYRYSGEYNIHRQLNPGVYFFAESYDKNQEIGKRVTLETFENERLSSKLYAESMIWDSITEKWVFQDYILRTIYADNEEDLKVGFRVDTALRLHPSDFLLKSEDLQTMNYRELNEHIKEQKLSGTSAIVLSEIEKYSRMANPFAAFILTIIGFSLSVRKIREGLGYNIGIGLLLSFSYILFMRFTTVFAISGMFSAFFAVWIPNILYAIIAIIIYKTAPR